ncbi:hypothetical protein R5H32_00625 [Defluviimonas sp. D31]|uniref:hypothetical protein n=1 Tax=Defluviimonas sp. D31 TaxID=3083253 RepID=UPI00296F93AC|nr:hypothetical protein [Defluviimonas sp. D31]MDW4547846.1 hypothetical protein [Defluviimonas sp. D31]
MTRPDLTIRKARAADAGSIVEMVNQASEGIALHFWSMTAPVGSDPIKVGVARAAALAEWCGPCAGKERTILPLVKLFRIGLSAPMNPLFADQTHGAVVAWPRVQKIFDSTVRRPLAPQPKFL